MKRLLIIFFALVWLSLPANAVRRQTFNLDVSSAELKTINGGSVNASDVVLFTRDESVLCFYFQEYDATTFEWSPFVVPSDADLKFGMKISTNRTGGYVVFSDNDKWNMSGDWSQAARTNGRMSVRVNCNTTAITSLFTSATTYMDFLCEIQMTEAGKTNPTTLAQFDARITHDIIQGSEGVSTAAAPTYVTQPALAAHASDTNNPHGVTANQISALPSAGGALTGSLNMTGHIISNATLINVDGSGLTGVPVVVTGDLNMNGHIISNASLSNVDGSGLTNLCDTTWSTNKAISTMDLNYHDIAHVETLDANLVTASGVRSTDVATDTLQADSIDEIYLASPLNADGRSISNASLVHASVFYGNASALSGFGGDVSGVGSNLQLAAGAVGPDELALGELQSMFMLANGTSRFDRVVVADHSAVSTNLIGDIGYFTNDASGWALSGDAYWALPGRVQVLESETGTMTLSNFNAASGTAYELVFKKGTTYSPVTVALGNQTNTYSNAVVGTIIDYFYCTGTGALRFAMSVSNEPDIFQYVDNVEMRRITNGVLQVVGDLYVDGRFHADGIDGDGTPIDSRSATNNVNMGGHSISNVVQITGGGNNDLFIAPNEECDEPYGTTPYPDLLLQAGCSPDNPGDLCLRSFGNIRFMFEDSSSEHSSIIADLPTADHGVTGSLWNDNGLVSLSGRETGTVYYSSKTSFKIHAGTNVALGGPSIQMMGTNYSGESPSLNGTKGSMWLMANADNSAAMGGYDRAVIIGYYEGGVPHDCLRSTPIGLYAESHMTMNSGTSFDNEYVKMSSLPTNAPSEYGRLWVSNGVLRVSGY